MNFRKNRVEHSRAPKKFNEKFLEFIPPSPSDMASSSNNKVKKGSKMLIRNVAPADPKFKL